MNATYKVFHAECYTGAAMSFQHGDSNQNITFQNGFRYVYSPPSCGFSFRGTIRITRINILERADSGLVRIIVIDINRLIFIQIDDVNHCTCLHIVQLIDNTSIR